MHRKQSFLTNTAIDLCKLLLWGTGATFNHQVAFLWGVPTPPPSMLFFLPRAASFSLFQTHLSYNGGASTSEKWQSQKTMRKYFFWFPLGLQGKNSFSMEYQRKCSALLEERRWQGLGADTGNNSIENKLVMDGVKNVRGKITLKKCS